MANNNLADFNRPELDLNDELARQKRELDLLHEIRKALIGVNDVKSIFQAAVESIARSAGFSMVTAYLLTGDQLHLQAQVGYDKVFHTLNLGDGANGLVALTSQGILLTNVKSLPQYLEAAENVSSAVYVPLLGPGREVLGTLSIESIAEPKLDERDFSLCQALAEHVVLAVAQALAYEREKRRLSQLALLNQVGRDLAAALDVKQIIERMTGPVRKNLNLYSVNVGIIEDNDLVFRLSSDDGGVVEYRWPLDNGSLVCHSATSGELIVCQDVSAEPRYRIIPELPHTKAEIILPLRSAGKIIGVLDVESDVAHIFEDDDIILFKTLADQTSVALTNARRFADLQRQSQELNASNQALAQANRLKSEFLANVSHELRTPLNSILGYVEMIQTGFYGDLTPELNDPLERVQRNSKRLMALISDVLDLANIEAGRLQLTIEDTLLSEFLGSIGVPAKTSAAEKGLTFQTHIVPGTPRVIQIDVTRLKQVVNILLSNALKFTREGGITILVDSKIDDNTDQFFSIVVKDTGIGIAPDEFEHIFEEFRQVDGSSTRQFGGTGLGLGLARRLVQMMGGNLSVTSEVAKGSDFTIWLPVKSLLYESDLLII